MNSNSCVLSRLRRQARTLFRLCIVLLAVLAAPVVAGGQVPPPDGDKFVKLLEDYGLAAEQPAARYVIADTDAGTYFTGMITPTSVKALQQRILSAKNNTTLIIDSPGGYDEAAIDLGRFLLDRRTRVIVRNRCVSACANFVFLPAFEKVVEPNSTVAFHSSVLWWDRMAREGRLKEEREAFEGRAQIAKKGAQLLRDGSADRDLNEVLNCMTEYLEPRLGSIKPAQMTNEEGKIVAAFTMDARYAFSILSPTNVRFLGIPGVVDFWWGGSFDEVQLAIERAVGKGLHRYGALGTRRFPCPEGSTGLLPTPWARS